MSRAMMRVITCYVIMGMAMRGWMDVVHRPLCFTVGTLSQRLSTP
jgi:hypothetical protein